MGVMIALVVAVLTYFRAFFVTRHRLGLEVAALRQQLVVFKRKQSRPCVQRLDRLFWVVLRRFWSGWAGPLIMVNSDTVVSWHRAGFRLFWRWRSRHRGRPKVSEEIRQLIRRLKCDNPTWGAPRIHGELLQLGFEISEPTVSRYLQRLKQRPDSAKAKRWLAFLHNHREVIAAFDFFTVPTLTFRVLYCFFVIEHHRRQILHFNVTANPTSEWIVQQLREALPLPCPYRYIVFDRDRKFDVEVRKFLKASGIQAVRTSVRSPWQNGVAERWVGSIRREMLDHVIPLNERHLMRLSQNYLRYYHEDRTHIGLNKNTPGARAVESRPTASAKVIALPRMGGLHHRYIWSAAA
jgi:putative transposase